MARTPRFYQAGHYDVGAEIPLVDTIFQHAIKVLRLKQGNWLKLFNDQGQTFWARLTQIQSKTAYVIIQQQAYEPNTESPLTIHLFPALIKADKMDLIVQKAVELGVTRITPLLSRYTDVKLSNKRTYKKWHHWQQVMIQACEQCGRSSIPELIMPTALSQIQIENHSPTIHFDPEATMNLQTLTTMITPTKINVIIGPEGGLTNEERQQLSQRNYHFGVQLGPRILRAETAVITALSLIQHCWGDL